MLPGTQTWIHCIERRRVMDQDQESFLLFLNVRGGKIRIRREAQLLIIAWSQVRSPLGLPADLRLKI